MELTCGVDSSSIETINIFSSRLKKSWDESNATWDGPDSGVNWAMSGAEGSSDRGIWEPPYYGSGNNTVNINVTAIVQDTVANNRSVFNFLLSAQGTAYDCHLSESSVSWVNHKSDKDPPYSSKLFKVVQIVSKSLTLFCSALLTTSSNSL